MRHFEDISRICRDVAHAEAIADLWQETYLFDEGGDEWAYAAPVGVYDLRGSLLKKL